jgi:hypothetical protein
LFCGYGELIYRCTRVDIKPDNIFAKDSAAGALYKLGDLSD